MEKNVTYVRASVACGEAMHEIWWWSELIGRLWWHWVLHWPFAIWLGGSDCACARWLHCPFAIWLGRLWLCGVDCIGRSPFDCWEGSDCASLIALAVRRFEVWWSDPWLIVEDLIEPIYRNLEIITPLGTTRARRILLILGGGVSRADGGIGIHGGGKGRCWYILIVPLRKRSCFLERKSELYTRYVFELLAWKSNVKCTPRYCALEDLITC